MRKHRSWIFIAMFSLNVIVSAYAAESIDMPVAKDGDRWEFKASTRDMLTSTTELLNGTYEVVFLKSRLEVFQVDGQKREASAGVAEKLKRMIAFGQDELRLLNFPLAIGKKWTVEYRHTSPGARRAHQRRVTFQVEKMEHIKTSAGEFKALRIKGTGGQSGSATIREWDYFYSSDTRGIVKFYYDSAVGQQSGKEEVELTKFNSPG